jgi:hypothetical protein
MKLQVDFAHGDIVIKRAMNGWIATTGTEFDDEITVTSVYEDPEYGECAESNSLLYLIREQFDSYVQTKKRGGIKLEVREKGYSYEEDEEVEKEFVDEAVAHAWPARPYCDVCGPLHAVGQRQIAPTRPYCDVCGRPTDEYAVYGRGIDAWLDKDPEPEVLEALKGNKTPLSPDPYGRGG